MELQGKCQLLNMSGCFKPGYTENTYEIAFFLLKFESPSEFSYLGRNVEISFVWNVGASVVSSRTKLVPQQTTVKPILHKQNASNVISSFHLLRLCQLFISLGLPIHFHLGKGKVFCTPVTQRELNTSTETERGVLLFWLQVPGCLCAWPDISSMVLICKCTAGGSCLHKTSLR